MRPYYIRYRLLGQREFTEVCLWAIDGRHARKLLFQHVASFGADPQQVRIVDISPSTRRNHVYRN